MTIRWQNDIERKAGSRTAWLDFLPQSTAWLLFLGPLEIRLARNFKRIRAIWWPTRHEWKRSRFLDLRRHWKGWTLSVMGLIEIEGGCPCPPDPDAEDTLRRRRSL
jgi:hypothetical protein